MRGVSKGAGRVASLVTAFTILVLPEVARFIVVLYSRLGTPPG